VIAVEKELLEAKLKDEMRKVRALEITYRASQIMPEGEAMEVTNGSQAAETSRVAVRLPPFWAERPTVRFTQAETQFSLSGISNKRIKFYHIISQLDHRYAAEVEDIITSPLHQDPYTALKMELLNHLSPTREQRACQIITHEEMGDRKPLQFLRHLRSLTRNLPEYFLRRIWCSRLPQPHKCLHGWVPVDIEIVNMSKQNIITASQLCNVINSQPYK
jgi:hypothetical protein